MGSELSEDELVVRKMLASGAIPKVSTYGKMIDELDKLRADNARLREAGTATLPRCRCHTGCRECNAMRAALDASSSATQTSPSCDSPMCTWPHCGCEPLPSCDSELETIRAARKRIATAAFDGQAYAAANADWRMNSASYVDALLGMVDELRAKLATAEQAANVWEEATAQTTEQLRAALTREEAAEKLASAWETTNMFESNRRDAAAQRVSELEEKLLVERSACEAADARAERYRSDLDNCGSTFMALRESSRRSAERAEAAERRVSELEETFLEHKAVCGL